jgi:hypothetical protein
LIAVGLGAVYMGIDGRSMVRSDLAREQIVGTPDSTIPGQKIDTGSEANAFATVMRKHTLEATGGQTYAQMGRFLDANGKPTNDEKAAAIDPKTKQPVENGLRNMWVNETALITALNVVVGPSPGQRSVRVAALSGRAAERLWRWREARGPSRRPRTSARTPSG